jgi:hypothetical protein
MRDNSDENQRIRRYRAAGILLVIFIIACPIFAFIRLYIDVQQSKQELWERRIEAKEAILAIEGFYDEHQRLPETLEEVYSSSDLTPLPEDWVYITHHRESDLANLKLFSRYKERIAYVFEIQDDGETLESGWSPRP